jgi:hypothetical protein
MSTGWEWAMILTDKTKQEGERERERERERRRRFTRNLIAEDEEGRKRHCQKQGATGETLGISLYAYFPFVRFFFVHF